MSNEYIRPPAGWRPAPPQSAREQIIEIVQFFALVVITVAATLLAAWAVS